MNFEQSKEFQKEIKSLSKKWRTLGDDLNAVKITIENLYVEQDEVDLQELRSAFFNGKRATVLRRSDSGHEAIKMRLDCSSPGANNKVRMIFVAIQSEESILFIQIYAKTKNEREDDFRIDKYLNSLRRSLQPSQHKDTRTD